MSLCSLVNRGIYGHVAEVPGGSIFIDYTQPTSILLYFLVSRNIVAFVSVIFFGCFVG
jgi:hypothetical protein